ncbi:MAG: hypothetical protein JXA21_09170 [Anaerolineae bacterium]|nr:hypothetical protein [Anaerolineae bacterium]
MKLFSKTALVFTMGWLVACSRSPQPSAQSLTTTPTLPPPPTPTGTILPDIPAPRPSPSPEEFAHWQLHPSFNDIRGLAFAPDGSLWAAIIGGVVHWDLSTDTATRYEIPGGPLSHVTHQIEIADDGVIWIATSSGVARFAPGTSSVWRIYTTADGLPSDVVYSVATAPGAIWVGTENGVARLNATAPAETAVWTTYTTEKGAPPTSIAYLAARDDVLWASVQGNGMIRYDAHSDTWEAVGGNFAYPNTGVIAIAPDGSPWVHIGYDNVYRFDGTAWQMAYEATGGRWVCDMAFGGNSTPYIATCAGFHSAGTGLAYWEGAQWAYFTMDDGLLSDNLSAVALATNGDLAAGTDRGISLYQNGIWRALRYGPTLREVTAVAVAPDNSVWVGFGKDAFYPAYGGLARLIEYGNWQYFDHTVLSEGTNIRALIFDASGNLWAASGCGISSLSRCCDEDSQWGTWIACEDNVSGNIRNIAFAPDGAAWFIDEFNVYRRDAAGLTIFGSKVPTALTVAPDGKVWLAHATVAGGGLSVFDGTNWITQTNVPIAHIVSLAATADGTVWASGQEGVMRNASGQWTGDKKTPNAEMIETLLVAPDGDVWGIAAHGLIHWKGAQREMIGVPPETTLYTGAFAPDGTLWLGTDQGVARYRE